MSGDEVRRARRRLGLTQREFAEKLGVHVVTVAKWEAGMQGMRGPAQKLIRLLEATTATGSTPKPRKGARKSQ